MSATVFLAICILGCDFLLYFLFQWTYGERRRGLARRSSSHRGYSNSQKSQPIEYVARKPRPVVPIQRPRAIAPTSARFEETRRTRQNERSAYQRIAASHVHAKH